MTARNGRRGDESIPRANERVNRFNTGPFDKREFERLQRTRSDKSWRRNAAFGMLFLMALLLVISGAALAFGLK